MALHLYLLLWAVAATAPSRLVVALGPVVRCEPCDSRALEQCLPLATECPEVVREPGCGCCLTCALQEGRPCGVYTERCGSGLRCRPRSDEQKPLQALLGGKGLCTNVSGNAAAAAAGDGRDGGSGSGSELRALLLRGTRGPGNSSDSEEDQNTNSTENQSAPNAHRLLDSKSHAHHTKIDIIRKEHTKNTQRYKYDSQSADTLNFSSDSKQETEYGPCRREMEDTLNNLKILNVLNPRGLHIPNCDKGFYKKKQCRPSRGRKRGYCWCVDKYGQPLPGYDGKGKGDVHCYNLESK
ncbi:insulin-like growth factor-binding protein 3 isoform X2 [Rhineura floridana]|uniref:insulin-like growth factor-binding protein 3 isoform X2 n=1 Tax=Rhineura floridana TaxID=261503 RepID=UPI002AC85967|nr:insulin-like growth factor-binding protein 3 isoform X2 [Rhineura floridana]